MENRLNQAHELTLNELREFVNSEDYERDNAIWVKNIFYYDAERHHIIIRAILDVEDNEIVAVWNANPQREGYFSEKTYGKDWTAYLTNPDDRTVPTEGRKDNFRWLQQPLEDYNPCKNCEIANKPYWSVISPCQGCVHNPFWGMPSITYTSTTVMSATGASVTNGTASALV